MAQIGLTKARSMGPVAVAVERQGGSVARVFRNAELPLRLIEDPDRLILLRDQLRLVECAARELGDVALPVRLSSEAGVASLGPYGERVLASRDLAEAIARGNALIGSMLQSSTRLQLRISGPVAKWSYAVTEKSEIGRQKNEFLALGFQLDLLRHFLGRSWTPFRASVSGSTIQSKSTLELALRCDLALDRTAGVAFPAELLLTENPRPPRQARRPAGLSGPELPAPADFVGCVEQILRLGLLEQRPPIDWVCARLGMTRRTFQRRLAACGASFAGVLRQALEREALSLLSGDAQIAQIALELGYSDPAHFSRAFHGWTGISPRVWRRRFEQRPHPS